MALPHRPVLLTNAASTAHHLAIYKSYRLSNVVNNMITARCSAEQHGGATAELGADGVEEMAEKAAEEGVPLGSNTTGCSLSLAGTGGNFEKTKAPIDGDVGKHAVVRNIRVVGLPGSVGAEVKAVIASDALCELVVADFLGAGVAESVEMRHGD
eukprot:6214481-Pleurochrysis_carterae.AAC.4